MQAQQLKRALSSIEMRDVFLQLTKQREAEAARDRILGDKVIRGEAATAVQQSEWAQVGEAHKPTKGKSVAGLKTGGTPKRRGPTGSSASTGANTPQLGSWRGTTPPRPSPSRSRATPASVAASRSSGSGGTESLEPSSYLQRRRNRRASFSVEMTVGTVLATMPTPPAPPTSCSATPASPGSVPTALSVLEA